MTAEIALLNKSAVALAADSAASIKTPTGWKVFNTVNKLFTLSKYHPVGVMVYGGAELMGVPWELIIKSYRRQLGDRSFAKLDNYVEDLLRFIEGHETLFPKDRQEAWVRGVFRGTLEKLAAAIKQGAEQKLKESGSIAEAEVAQLVLREVDQLLVMLNAIPEVEHLKAHLPELEAAHTALFDEEATSALQVLPVDSHTRDRLRSACMRALIIDSWTDHHSGVVVSGYGDEEFYPSLVALRTEAVIAGKVRYRFEHRASVNATMGGAAIVPFAQKEMVQTLMEGIDPKYAELISSGQRSALGNFADMVANALPNMPPDAKTGIRLAAQNIASKLDEAFAVHRQQFYVGPIVNAVALLPKDDLAAMAESLVNLTSFKRKISLDAETVGGPIDVAVISKADGFIWIKRKHYFDAQLNHGFMTNYFRRGNHEEG